MTLAPLNERDLTQFIADIVHRKPESVRPLSYLCLQKTQGNPFFFNQFLNTLYQQKLIQFDHEQKAWSWDLDAINKACKRIYGYSKEEFSNLTLFDVTNDLEKAQNDVKKTLGGALTTSLVRYHKKKDGSVFPIEISLGKSSQQGQDFMYGILRDITERLQAEKEKEKLQTQLQQAVKMQAVGTLAGGIAHEFNNLLGVIMGCTDMALDEVPGDSFVKTQLENVMTASYRVKDLVKQILAFSRQAQQKRISVNLAFVVKESLKLIQSSIPSSVEVKENLNPSCGNAHVDPTEIQQIIMNLTSNAVWAMKENGTIEN